MNKEISTPGSAGLMIEVAKGENVFEFDLSAD
jgi:hypothetical protein